MSTKEADGDSSDGVECPTCGREDFKNQKGLKRHHAIAHDESIAGVVVNCHTCGSEKEVTAYKAENTTRHFCSEQCRREWLSESNSGEENPSWNGGKVVMECASCGADYRVAPHRVDNTSFCSKSCQGDQMADQTGEETPHWQGGPKTSICEVCGDEFNHKRDGPRTCSEECKGRWMSENLTGEAHPMWKEDTTNLNYGGGWKPQRRRARERDGGECQVCGHTPDSGESKLDVHHIRPLRTFDEPSEAHDLDNLITLCRQCHKDWEGIPVAPQLVDA